MSIPLIPWEPANIPEELQSELDRRKINRSFVYVRGEQGSWDNATGDWNKYRGPMSPWIRFCSNGIGLEKSGVPPKPGFIMFSGKDFYSGYGFRNNSSGSFDSIIGYMPNKEGTPHTIENDVKKSNYPIHVPPPEIDKITVTIQKELFRRATVEWICFSKKQLEYMTPYFLVPGITCILEWGWNHFDPSSLLDLSDIDGLKKLNNNPYPLYNKYILRSRGNYDVLFGKVTHFEWSVDGNKIRCKTEITSQDRIYSGLMVDSSMIYTTSDGKGAENDQKPLDGLETFVSTVLTQFKSVSLNKNPQTIPQLYPFIQYVKKVHPNNWREYVYGIFYGRDLEDTKKDAIPYDNKKEDFDRKSPNKELWINMGLLLEVLNYHAAELKGFKGAEMFRVDIDNVVIGAHPNLISTDGSILLIPNKEAPKYFNGLYGKNQPASSQKQQDRQSQDYSVFNTTTNPIIKISTKKVAAQQGKLSDYRLAKTCLQVGGAYRDNLDEIINKIRYTNSRSTNTFEFPFVGDRNISPGSKPYPAHYSGYLKNLYFNVKAFQEIISNADNKTYPMVIEKVLEQINKATGNFWDFRLVAGTGDDSLPSDSSANMKVVDYRFVSSINRGKVYTFDYFDADSLLLGMSFKPTLSNAQAIRTIYAQTNNPDKKVVLSDTNELLDYKFRDRLFVDEDRKSVSPIQRSTHTFDETMRELQQLSPKEGSYQMTTKNANNFVLVRRLAMPSPEVLKIFLDDGDEQNNPKYTGIMPGIQANFTIQGIGGLRTFMMFLVRNLPEPYSHQNIVFRIVDVQEAIESGKWTTTITAGVIPLRDHIKKRLGLIGVT